MEETHISLNVQQHFERLFHRSRGRAYKLAYRLTGNPTEAEDVTQDAYLRAWSSFASFDANCSFEGWLFRIIANRAIDLHRRKKRVQIHSFDLRNFQGADGVPPFYEFVDPAPGPEETVLAPVMDERLRAALLRLPAGYRSAILLKSVEQLSYQEIATRTNCAPGTVRSRLHRARSLLRRYLDAGETANTD